jgi:hypothetical protein
MTIETKHNPGDPAWRINDNKVIEDSIFMVYVKVSNNLQGEPIVEEAYQLNFGGGGWKSGSFYPTREALLASL